MTRRGWLLRRARRTLGWPGLAGLGLLALAPLLYAGLALPEHLRLAGLQQQVAAAKTRAAAPAGTAESGIESRLAAFYSEFPVRETAPDWLEKIYAAGNATALALEKVDYKLNPDRDSRLLRYEIDLPVHGGYVQIRQFIQAVLAEIPTLALRDVQISRGSIAEPTVEAQLRFVLYLREAA